MIKKKITLRVRDKQRDGELTTYKQQNKALKTLFPYSIIRHVVSITQSRERFSDCVINKSGRVHINL